MAAAGEAAARGASAGLAGDGLWPETDAWWGGAEVWEPGESGLRVGGSLSEPLRCSKAFICFMDQLAGLGVA